MAWKRNLNRAVFRPTVCIVSSVLYSAVQSVSNVVVHTRIVLGWCGGLNTKGGTIQRGQAVTRLPVQGTMTHRLEDHVFLWLVHG